MLDDAWLVEFQGIPARENRVNGVGIGSLLFVPELFQSSALFLAPILRFCRVVPKPFDQNPTTLLAAIHEPTSQESEFRRRIRGES